jgi:hypothetical protein
MTLFKEILMGLGLVILLMVFLFLTGTCSIEF